MTLFENEIVRIVQNLKCNYERDIEISFQQKLNVLQDFDNQLDQFSHKLKIKKLEKLNFSEISTQAEQLRSEYNAFKSTFLEALLTQTQEIHHQFEKEYNFSQIFDQSQQTLISKKLQNLFDTHPIYKPGDLRYIEMDISQLDKI